MTIVDQYIDLCAKVAVAATTPVNNNQSLEEAKSDLNEFLHDCGMIYHNFIADNPTTSLRYHHKKKSQGVVAISFIKGRLFLSYALKHKADRWNKNVGRALAIEAIQNAVTGEETSRAIEIDTSVPIGSKCENNCWLRAVPQSLQDTAYSLYRSIAPAILQATQRELQEELKSLQAAQTVMENKILALANDVGPQSVDTDLTLSAMADEIMQRRSQLHSAYCQS